ncbi:MAG: DUF115 domain-containing protein, partial [Lachnospiraceae bacterium]|nr:DUF115 domain-containing protein [Lachnospiraceae bacterium]
MSNDIYSNNMNVISRRFPDVAEYLNNPPRDAGTTGEEADITVSIVNVDGKRVLCASKASKMYRLDSLYDPASMLDIWFEGLGERWDLNGKLYMYGFGNGIFARKFLGSAREDCRLIIHEPSYKILDTVIRHFDISDILEDTRLELIFWPLFLSKTLTSFYMDLMSYSDVFSYKTAIYMNYPVLFPSSTGEYINGLKRTAEYVGASQNVTDRFGAYYSRNTLSNLQFLRESKDILNLAENMPEDIPAIIVAAGPSLDNNIGELAKAKGKSIIISTDTALKPLSLAGIVPDIAVIMDGKKDERYLSEADSREVPLVCTPRSGTNFLHLHKGIKFFTDDYCDHIDEFMRSVDRKLLRLETGGSVANSCFSLAMLLRCRRIILVGQDLAYTENKTHSEETVRGSVKTEIKDLEHVVMDTDINGNPIRSSEEFRFYREWFEQKIKENPELSVIDATEGGVRIAGSILMTAKDAIDKYCTDEFDFRVIVSETAPLFDDKTKEKYDDYIKDIPRQMGELRSLISATLADYKAMRGLVQSDNYRNSRMRNLYDNCQRQTRKIEASPVIEYVHNQ